jgi:thiamine-phosphate pyrophosphorylase
MHKGIRTFAYLCHKASMKTQFFLLTPRIFDPEAFLPKLDGLMATGIFSVIHARFAPASEPDFKRRLASLQTPIQAAGIACLIDVPDDPRLIARAGLDGAHVSEAKRLDDALLTLKPDRIVGVGGIKSRHDAMEAGEKDIDYVMFGEPRLDDSLPPPEQTIERAQWWASIFNVPCIGYASDLAMVAPLAEAMVEFVALGPWIFESDDPAALAIEAKQIAKAHAPSDLMLKSRK